MNLQRDLFDGIDISKKFSKGGTFCFESVPQWALDPLYSRLHVLDATKKWIQDPHTAYLKNFLPAGNISRPSIVSLMSGIYDAQLELNEMESFWKGELLTVFVY